MALMKVRQKDGTVITVPLGLASNISGRGIVSVNKTYTEYLETGETRDTYTIIYTDNTTSNFNVVSGKSGESAYSYAVRGGYEGTELEFAEKLAQEFPKKVSQLENDKGYIDNTVANLSYYYDKNNTYNRDEINSLFSTFPKFTRKVVDVLPEIGLDNTLYLVRKQESSDDPDRFEEWLWTDGTWEHLGSHTIDLEDYAKKSDISSLVRQTFELIYPVGSIYISASAENPAQLFNFGQWEPVQDKFLLAGGIQYPAGSTGGESTHTLSANELPKLGGSLEMHNAGYATPVHKVNDINGYSNILSPLATNAYFKNGGSTAYEAGSIGGVKITFGGNYPHNNMPPYLAVYVWKRVS